jgi:dihydroorotase
MTPGLLLCGGNIFDPESATWTRADLLIADGQIADRADARATPQTVDVSRLLVTPGLIDLHTHVFVGQDLGVDPDVVGPPSGVTTFIDTGSAGAHLFGAFRRSVLDRCASRVRAFLNISTIGTTSILCGGELENLGYCDEDATVACAQANSDVIIGIKVRASGNVVGASGGEPLRRARRVADRLDLPLMVHLGPAPPSTEEILSVLRAGDILTHCCTGFGDNALIQHGRLRAAAQAARRRGVLFDVGHGMSGFDAVVAQGMVDAGFVPDTISTDLHAYSLTSAEDLPTVMSKLMALGLTLEDVLTRATLAPARCAGLADTGVGTLRPGAPADITAFELVDGPVTYRDPSGHAFTGHARLRAAMTIRGGAIVHDGRQGQTTGERR